VEINRLSGFSVSDIQNKETYEVKAGETLQTIAQQFGITPEALATANGLSPDAQVSPGSQLIIPPSQSPSQNNVFGSDLLENAAQANPFGSNFDNLITSQPSANTQTPFTRMVQAAFNGVEQPVGSGISPFVRTEQGYATPPSDGRQYEQIGNLWYASKAQPDVISAPIGQWKAEGFTEMQIADSLRQAGWTYGQLERFFPDLFKPSTPSGPPSEPGDYPTPPSSGDGNAPVDAGDGTAVASSDGNKPDGGGDGSAVASSDPNQINPSDLMNDPIARLAMGVLVQSPTSWNPGGGYDPEGKTPIYDSSNFVQGALKQGTGIIDPGLDQNQLESAATPISGKPTTGNLTDGGYNPDAGSGLSFSGDVFNMLTNNSDSVAPQGPVARPDVPAGTTETTNDPFDPNKP